jgi:hypothetical protein
MKNSCDYFYDYLMQEGRSRQEISLYFSHCLQYSEF